VRIGAGIEGSLQFPGRGNVNAIDQPGHEGDERRHRIGFHRVM